ncbi:MAG: 4Fe-4S dicluster domain-containing protein [Chloroflexaceae bacterium]|nr:4Fe-4S dicluster domain-containing protein [Chloroflexaceae bacterium]
MHRTLERLTTPAYQTMLQQCIHCGMCLQACPTYHVFGTEMDSPRGRIVFLQAAANGAIDQDGLSLLTTHLDRCLGCRACEPACPSNVQYGRLLEEARIALQQQQTPGLAERFVRWIGLDLLLPHRQRLKRLAWLCWFYQICRLQSLVRASGWLPEPLNAMEQILPPIIPRYRRDGQRAPALGTYRGRVGFFAGCVQEAFLAPVNEASIRVLQRNGFEVVEPSAQTCCGAAHIHLGAEAQAQELARRNIDAFTAQPVDAIVTNAGGCGLMLKEYAHLLKDDPVYAQKAAALVARTYDIHAFLAEHLYVPPTGRLTARVAYVDSCHLRHGQRVIQQPRSLLRLIPGVELVDLHYPDRCCGSAGVYNITQIATARTILDAKMDDIRQTNATMIATSNTGCHLQLIAGSRQSGLALPVHHVVEVLEQSYQQG